LFLSGSINRKNIIGQTVIKNKGGVQNNFNFFLLGLLHITPHHITPHHITPHHTTSHHHLPPTTYHHATYHHATYHLPPTTYHHATTKRNFLKPGDFVVFMQLFDLKRQLNAPFC
jgi:hypothetical protein